MKLNFGPDRDYELQAINAVSDPFRGLEICRTGFPSPGAPSSGPASSTNEAISVSVIGSGRSASNCWQTGIGGRKQELRG